MGAPRIALFPPPLKVFRSELSCALDCRGAGATRGGGNTYSYKWAVQSGEMAK